jgi:hypothetical protein
LEKDSLGKDIPASFAITLVEIAISLQIFCVVVMIFFAVDRLAGVLNVTRIFFSRTVRIQLVAAARSFILLI